MAKAMPELKKFGPPDGCIFFHPLFVRHPPVAVILEETHRANGEWFEALNRVRDCHRTSSLSDFDICPPQHTRHDGEDKVHMCYRRVTAHNRNAECLARLPGSPRMLQLRDGEMELKEGCDVIVTSNRAGGGYINGSRAVFSGINEDGLIVLDDGNPLKMLADGNWGHYSGGTSTPRDSDIMTGMSKARCLLARCAKILEADARKWLEQLLMPHNEHAAGKFGEGRIVFQPYWPILPGYALTVHKAQGSTLSGIVIEEDVFWNISPARLPYVAFSRVSSESDVSLAGFLPNSARVRPDSAYPTVFSRIKGWSVKQ